MTDMFSGFQSSYLAYIIEKEICMRYTVPAAVKWPVTLLLSSLEQYDHVHYGETTLIP